VYEVNCAKCMTPQLASDGACSVCGTPVSKVPGDQAPRSSIFGSIEKPPAQPIFFPVSVLKFIVMDLATFGLYQIFWAFMSWHYFASLGHRVRPGWRAWLPIFYLHSLLKEIVAVGKAAGLTKSYSPTGVFVTWLIFQCSAFLPDTFCFWLVRFVLFLPLIPVVRYVNEINRITGKAQSINSQFSVSNWFGIAVGAVILLCSARSSVLIGQ